MCYVLCVPLLLSSPCSALLLVKSITAACLGPVDLSPFLESQ